MKNLKTQNGFSLPELMMVAAIMGGLALGIAKLTQNGLEGGKRVEAGGQINEVKNEILGVLSSRDACIKTFFTNNDFSDVVGGGTKTITAIKDKNNINRYSSPKVYSGVNLSTITVKDYDPVKKTAGLYLNFNYNLNSKTQMTKFRKIDLALELDPANKLISCVALAGVQNIDLKQLCDGVIGFDTNGNSYFGNGECQFEKASCEKGGGLWDATLEKCQLGAEQRFNVRKAACDSDRGYFMKFTQGWSYSIEGLGTSAMCTVADIRNDYKCLCRTKFMNRLWHGMPAPTEPDSTGYQAKRFTLAGGKFSIVSPIITLSNPFPDGDNRPRYVKMFAQVHVDNVSTDTKPRWITMGIGCYRPNRSAYRAQQDYFPSISSSDYYTVHSPGGYKYQSDDFRPEDANGTQIMHSPTVSRGNFISYSGGGIYIPGDKCAVILYTHNSGTEVLVGGILTQSEHSTIDSDYGYGPSSWPVSNGF